MARDGRRRRFLNDEVRTASGLSLAGRSESRDSSAEAPRYGEQANIEHHPQITDFVPRRKRALLVTLTAGLGIAAGAQTLSHFASTVAAVLPGVTAQQVDAQFARGLTAWTSAVALLIVAVLARIIYSLRRHRVDDSRGRYRVWRWTAWAAVLASVDAVVHAHVLMAQLAIAATGWSLTAGGAEWWLVPLAIPALWVGFRLIGEMAESRSSLAISMLAAACYAVAAAGALGWTPAALGSWVDMLTRSLPLAGHILALAGLMIFARYVVLDVQGLIEHKPRRAAKPARQKKVAKTAKEEETPVSAPAARNVATAKSNERPGGGSANVRRSDDDEAGDEEDETSGDRYLSKSERKRLRKQQQRRAA